MTVDFSAAFSNLLQGTNVSPTDVCTQLANTASYLQLSMVDSAAAYASGTSFTYSATTNPRINPSTNATVSEGVLQGIATQVNTASSSLQTQTAPITTGVGIAVSRYLTCTALAQQTSGPTSYWQSMYDTYIHPALSSATFDADFPTWKTNCYNAITSIPQLIPMASQMNVVQNQTNVGDQFAQLLLILNGTRILETYLQQRMSQQSEFYNNRCDQLALSLSIVYLFDYVYSHATGKGTVITNFKDPLTTVGIQLTQNTATRQVTLDVESVASDNATKIEAVSTGTDTLKRNQITLESTLSSESVAKKHKRRAIMSFVIWLLLLLVLSLACLSELRRGSPRSALVISGMIVVGLSVYWMVAIVRSMRRT